MNWTVIGMWLSISVLVVSLAAIAVTLLRWWTMPEEPTGQHSEERRRVAEAARR